MKRGAAILLALGLAACASPQKYGVVMPKGGDIYQVTARGRTEEQASIRANRAAALTCEERGKAYAVDAVNVSYGGVLAEATNGKIDLATEIAGAFTRADIPSTRGRSDYRVEMAFRCE
jgi:hypothetical protein